MPSGIHYEDMDEQQLQALSNGGDQVATDLLNRIQDGTVEAETETDETEGVDPRTGLATGEAGYGTEVSRPGNVESRPEGRAGRCLLYTSDAADE